MSFKSFMGSVSPLYGAVSGEGSMGRMLNPSKAAEIAKEEQAKIAAAEKQAENEAYNKNMESVKDYKPYKKGGSVKSKSASSRADGIAQRGKTRGTIVMCGGGMSRGKK